MRTLLVLLVACGGTNPSAIDAPEEDPPVDAPDAEVVACQASTAARGDCFDMSVVGGETFTVEVCPFSCTVDDTGQIGFIAAQSLDNQRRIAMRWELPAGETNAGVAGRVLVTNLTVSVTTESITPRTFEAIGPRVFVDEYTADNVKACILGNPIYDRAGNQLRVSSPSPVVLNCPR